MLFRKPIFAIALVAALVSSATCVLAASALLLSAPKHLLCGAPAIDGPPSPMHTGTLMVRRTWIQLPFKSANPVCLKSIRFVAKPVRFGQAAVNQAVKLEKLTRGTYPYVALAIFDTPSRVYDSRGKQIAVICQSEFYKDIGVQVIYGSHKYFYTIEAGPKEVCNGSIQTSGLKFNFNLR